MPSFLQRLWNYSFPQTLKGLFKEIKAFIPGAYTIKAYSQEGEDMILRRFFEGKKQGFYVDVGAHHPKRFSNTYFFYKMGWHGINIDAMPGSMKLFRLLRPKDINLETAISEKKESLTFCIFNDPALSGFSESLNKRRTDHREFRIVAHQDLPTVTLREALDIYMPQGQPIDFLSVDVEGHDLQVLRSNEWRRYRPSVVVVETLECEFEDVRESEVHRFMESMNYVLMAKSLNSLFFRAREDLYFQPLRRL
jgi:FkbM family methyltransferase